MSYAHVGGAAAAEAKKRMQREEEEEVNRYSDSDLQGDWEFKFVRSQTGAFSKRETLDKVVAEEAAAGWVLLEKFDDNRLRFKRPVSARRNDYSLSPGIDPYRSKYGIGEMGLVFLIFGVMAAVGGLIALLVFLFSSGA